MDQLVALLREQLDAAEERADAAEERAEREQERAEREQERADRERRRADRAVDRANQRIDELSRNLRQTNHNLEESNRNLRQTSHNLEETNRNLVQTSHNLEETNRNLDDTNTQLNRTNNLLEWKSLTSTKNPDKIELTHQFLITAGRKKRTDGGIVHVPKEGRRQITKHEVPQLNDREFVRVNVHSRQNRTIDDALKLREKQNEWVIQRGYMGNGIDFRQNVKAEGKRRWGDDEPLFLRANQYNWSPSFPISWQEIWEVVDMIRVKTAKKPAEIDIADYERAREGIQDIQQNLELGEIDVPP